MRPGWWLVLLLVLGISPAQAQAIDVQVRCAGPLQEGLPPNFEGTIYRVLTPFPYAGNGRWELEAITAQGSVLTDIPVPADLNLKISPVEISPDGRYVVFDPVQDGTALAVWDRLSNAMTSLELPSETTEYLNTGITPLWRHQLKIDWLSPNQFVIRYFDLENEIFLDLLAEQVFTVTTNPLAIDAGPKQEIEYPSLPFPRDENLNTTSFSPRRTYVQALFEDEFKPWLDFRFQIYDAVTLEQVADFNSTEIFRLPREPRWSQDESVLFLRYNNGDVLGRITEVCVEDGFQESTDFLDTLLQTFGPTFSVNGLRADISPYGPRLFMTISASDYTPYAVVYDYQARTLTAVCRGRSTGGSTITYSQAYPVWGGGEDIIGYYDVGNLYLFDTVSGQSYYRDVFPFVGWLASTESVTTTAATPVLGPPTTSTP